MNRFTVNKLNENALVVSTATGKYAVDVTEGVKLTPELLQEIETFIKETEGVRE